MEADLEAREVQAGSVGVCLALHRKARPPAGQGLAVVHFPSGYSGDAGGVGRPYGGSPRRDSVEVVLLGMAPDSPSTNKRRGALCQHLANALYPPPHLFLKPSLGIINITHM